MSLGLLHSATMTTVLRGLLATVMCVGVMGCAGGQQAVNDEPMPPNEREREPMVGKAPVCVDENDDPVECEDDGECCANFACARDPELNPRKKYCVYVGQ